MFYYPAFLAKSLNQVIETGFPSSIRFCHWIRSTIVVPNGSPEMLEAGVRNSKLGKFLDYIISVDIIKIFKPSPKVYQLATDQLGCNTEEILFFSSNAWDVSGASTFGFKTIWVNRFAQATERLPGTPIMEINTLDAVL